MRNKGLLSGYMSAVMMVAVIMLLGGCAERSSGGTRTVQAVALIEDGEYQEALTVLESALSGGEEQVPALRARGLAYLALGSYDEAETAFTQAREATDERMPETRRDIRLYLLLTYLRDGKYDEVLSQSTLLEEEDGGTSTESAYYQGAAYLGQGDQTQAASQFDLAVAASPTDYALYLQIYQLYEEASLSAVGDAYLQQALSTTPEGEEQQVQVGQIYVYLEQYDQAMAMIADLVSDRYEPAMQLQGEIYLAQADYLHAQSLFQSMLENEGATPRIYNGLMQCAMASEDYGTALSYAETGLALEEEEGKQQLRFNEIVAYEKQLDFTTALTKAEVYVQLYPTDEAGLQEYAFLKTQG